jgi:hypothetical protein
MKLNDATVYAVSQAYATAYAICEASGRDSAWSYAVSDESEHAKCICDCDVFVMFDVRSQAYSVVLMPRASQHVPPRGPVLTDWSDDSGDMFGLFACTCAETPFEVWHTSTVHAWREALSKLADAAASYKCAECIAD